MYLQNNSHCGLQGELEARSSSGLERHYFRCYLNNLNQCCGTQDNSIKPVMKRYMIDMSMYFHRKSKVQIVGKETCNKTKQGNVKRDTAG